MADYPQIQGRYVSWASLEISAFGVETDDFAKLDWKDALEPGKVKGTGPHKQGRTVGEYEPDGSMSMYLDSFNTFQEKLATVNPSIGLVVFDVLGYWSEQDGGKVHEIKMEGCRLKTRSNSNAPGTDATVVEVDLDPMIIRLNGITLLEPKRK